jgi:hypothetical protein
MADTGRTIRQWRQLPAADRRRLLKLARRGKPESDRQVAEVGVAWAEAVLAARTTQSSRWPGRILTFLLSMVAPAAIAGGSYADNLGVQWIARKILQANRPVDWRSSGTPMEQDQMVRTAVRARLFDELRFRSCARPMTIDLDRLSDLADNLADVVVGNFAINPPNGESVEQGQETWLVVHTAILGELESRANSGPLTIEPDQLNDWADHLADVILGRFKVSPRPLRRRGPNR